MHGSRRNGDCALVCRERTCFPTGDELGDRRTASAIGLGSTSLEVVVSVLLVEVEVVVVLMSKRNRRWCREQSQGRAKGKLCCSDLHDFRSLKIVGSLEQKKQSKRER